MRDITGHLIWLNFMNIQYSCSLNKDKIEHAIILLRKNKSFLTPQTEVSSAQCLMKPNENVNNEKLRLDITSDSAIGVEEFDDEKKNKVKIPLKHENNEMIGLNQASLQFENDEKNTSLDVIEEINVTIEDELKKKHKSTNEFSSINFDVVNDAIYRSNVKENIFDKLKNDHKEDYTKSEPNKLLTEDTRFMIKDINNISELREFVLNFDKCKLKYFANNTVFSDGVIGSKILLIGEAPGAKEDEFGIPFCGESGELLDNMLASINLSRKENVYITNTIFWRPPANRKPTEEEVEICRPLLEKHIALIDPKLIILVGSTAATSVLKTSDNVSQMRGRFYEYSNIYIKKPIHTTVIFHPAYLLRQPKKKKETWYDLIRIQQFIKDNLYY